jgi:uncharacterized protein (TIGR03437 family)
MKTYQLNTLLILSCTVGCTILFPGPGYSQVLDNNFLSGRYGFRQTFLSTNAIGSPVEARSLSGVLSFDGRGGFSFQGTRLLGTQAPAPFNGNGSYTVDASGAVSMTNPLVSTATINARLGNGLLLGSTTDSAGNNFDLFVALPLPGLAASNATLSGAYNGVTLEIPNGLYGQIKNTFFRFTSNGQGSLAPVDCSGQSVPGGNRVQRQVLNTATYGISGDSTGTLLFPLNPSLTQQLQLLAGDKQIFLSANGEYFLGGSNSQGAHEILFGAKAVVGTATAPVTEANLSGLYFGAGLKVENSRPASFVGAVSSQGGGRAVWSRRVRVPEGNVDATAVNAYTLGSDGVGSILNNRFVLGSAGNVFIAAGTSFVNTDNYEIFIGIKTRPLSGTGVFLNPLGVTNGASFAPAGNPIAPGQFVALFGTGLGPTNALIASGTPFPVTLGGVSVTIQDRPAPLYFVSSGQISALVPFATSGTSAEIVVRNGATESNRVTVPVARTSPGIYSNSQNGIGAGAILKADFSIVSTANPVRRGDTVLIYLTGLGGLNPALSDGAAASTTVLSRVTDTVNVYIGGRRAVVSFAGAAPGFAGLYQINVTIPTDINAGNAVPIGIETSTAFHDMVDIAVTPL